MKEEMKMRNNDNVKMKWRSNVIEEMKEIIS